MRSNDAAHQEQAYFLQSCIEGPDTVDMHVAEIIYEFEILRNNGQKFHVTADHYGSNRDVPLYTKTYTVHADNEKDLEDYQLEDLAYNIETLEALRKVHNYYSVHTDHINE
mgnify:CR=1 FL=1